MTETNQRVKTVQYHAIIGGWKENKTEEEAECLENTFTDYRCMPSWQPCMLTTLDMVPHWMHNTPIALLESVQE